MTNTLKKVITSKIVKNSLWLTILQIANTIIPMITIPYLARVLGTTKYGVFSIALNWILYLQVVVEFGFGYTGARKVALCSKNNDLKKVNRLFNSIISSRIILLIICFVLFNFIAILGDISRQVYLSMMLLFTMIIGTTFQLTWLFQGMQDMKFITIVNLISRLITTLLIFIFIKNEKDIYLYCLLYSATTVISSIISLIIAKRKYKLRFRFAKTKEIKEELIDSKELFISNAMTKIFSGIGITFLGILSTAEISGIFSAISKIPYVLTMLFLPISQSLFPHNSSTYNNNLDNYLSKIKKIMKYIYILFLIPCTIILIFRKKIILILFGSEYAIYSNAIIPLILQFLVAIFNNFIGVQTLVATGHQKNYSKAFLISSIITVILNYLLCAKYNIYGVAYAALIAELILFSLLQIELKKIRYNEQLIGGEI